MSTSSDTAIDGWTFNAGASSYIISNSHWFDFNGAGIVVNGGSGILKNTGTVFFHSGTAGSATIINNAGGTVSFWNSGTGGTARLINDGVVDLTYLFDAPGITLGLVEGSGVFQLATKNLTVGATTGQQRSRGRFWIKVHSPTPYSSEHP